jgi:hypothetical protein
MKGFTPELVNIYDCLDCKEKSIKHKVEFIYINGKQMRKCSMCGAMDGPWIDSNGDIPAGDEG